MTTLEKETRPYALAAGDGTAFAWFGSAITVKASRPELGLTEVSMNPGDEPPLHVHKHEDEYLYVLEGEMTFHAGPENHRAKAGGFVFFPRGIPHTFTVESGQARFLVMNTPGGFEHMFEAQPQTKEEAIAALRKFDLEVVGPHPRETTA